MIQVRKEDGTIQNMTVAEYNDYLASLRSSFKVGEDGKPVDGRLGNEDIGKVWINGNEYTGMSYGGLVTVNTKTYVEEPVRANDGSIPNINDYDTFIVPRCRLNFKYFNIEDYKRLCNDITSNEFKVKYFDKQFGTYVEHNMYAEPEEMYKIYNVGTSVIGVLDYEVSFIGTLNELPKHTVTYYANSGSLKNDMGAYSETTTYSKGDRVIWEGEYYEAIYEDVTVPTKANAIEINPNDDPTPPNSKYWETKYVTEWNETLQYNFGDVVYQMREENGKTNYYYYQAIYEGTFYGRLLSNKKYWKNIAITNYNNQKEYVKDTYVYTISETPLTTVYKAIYYNTEFTGITTQNPLYWKQLTTIDGSEVTWGNSIVVSEIENLFDAPEGYASANEWNTQPNGTGYTYYPNQSLNVFTDLKLYAQWEKRKA